MDRDISSRKMGMVHSILSPILQKGRLCKYPCLSTTYLFVLLVLVVQSVASLPPSVGSLFQRPVDHFVPLVVHYYTFAAGPLLHSEQFQYISVFFVQHAAFYHHPLGLDSLPGSSSNSNLNSQLVHSFFKLCRSEVRTVCVHFVRGKRY